MDSIEHIDRSIIKTLRSVSIPLARGGLFVVYFWFGALKLFDTSPANPLIADLLEKTLPFITFEQFIFFFGIFEMAIGICFLIPGLERAAIALLIPHMVTTFLPLVLLPAVTWQNFLTPTLEGQYIVKNLVIIALAFSIAGHLRPLDEKEAHQGR